MDKQKKTIVGTDIEEVKQRNAQSGLTYNEAKVAYAEKKMRTNKK